MNFSNICSVDIDQFMSPRIQTIERCDPYLPANPLNDYHITATDTQEAELVMRSPTTLTDCVNGLSQFKTEAHLRTRYMM